MPKVRSVCRPLLLLVVGVLLLSQGGQAQFGGGGGGGLGSVGPANPPSAGHSGTPSSAKPIKPIRAHSVTSPAHPYFPLPSEREEMLKVALNENFSAAFSDTPLSDCLSFTSEKLGLALHFDRESLNDEAIPLDTPVTLEVPEGKLPLRSVLQMFLRPLKLTAINSDGVLVVTTLTRAAETQVTRVYPVADLTDSEQPATFQELMTVIETETSYSWKTISGDGGTITASQTLRSLVVRTTHHQHDEIVELLSALRAARDSQ